MMARIRIILARLTFIKISSSARAQVVEHKYDPASLAKINGAIEEWINADAERGIQTVHVEVDNSKDKTMRE